MVSLLRVKAAIVGTSLEGLAGSLRWHLGLLHRFRFPEQLEANLEEQRLPLVLKKLLNGDANCVDVGCHIGSFLSLVRKMAPNGTHIAVEASPTKAQWLVAKFPDVTVHNVAVADKNGRATFEDNARRPGYSRLLTGGNRDPSNSYYDVDLATLDDLLAGVSRIDLLKIDIEGGELNALKGAVQVITRTRPVILFEVGSEYALEKMNVSRQELYDLLTGLGYAIYTFTDILFDKEPVQFSEFRKCGLWPFRAFNFVAKPI